MSRAMRAADGIWWMRTLMVNVAFIGSSERWVLVDAGFGGYSGSIAAAAAELFGTERGPASIVLTHGHFDHVGSLERLIDRWDVPVYAHRLELPYLTGRSSYPPPDPLVGGGAMAWSARLYPRGPIDLDGRVQPLPEDGTVPGAPGWRWMHTPGHSPGHVSLVREQDAAMIAGDAINDQAGIPCQRRDTAAGITRAARILHARLGHRRAIRAGARGAPAAGPRVRPRGAHARAAAARCARAAGRSVRARRGSRARAVCRQPGAHGRSRDGVAPAGSAASRAGAYGPASCGCRRGAGRHAVPADTRPPAPRAGESLNLVNIREPRGSSGRDAFTGRRWRRCRRRTPMRSSRPAGRGS
jgi:glyoxylase-like metal-dependent hydrolase (beta-lactamase superfamily II)